MKKLLLLFVLCLCFPVVDKACTSIIITGKATPDGRPLMWKHRDTGAPYNHISYFDEGGYRFLGLVNSDDPEGAVWTGSNETGFSIMNITGIKSIQTIYNYLKEEHITPSRR